MIFCPCRFFLSNRCDAYILKLLFSRIVEPTLGPNSLPLNILVYYYYYFEAETCLLVLAPFLLLFSCVIEVSFSLSRQKQLDVSTVPAPTMPKPCMAHCNKGCPGCRSFCCGQANHVAMWPGLYFHVCEHCHDKLEDQMA